MVRAAHRPSALNLVPTNQPHPELVYQPKPTEFWGADKRAQRVYSPGPRGIIWSPYWILDRVDDGACRVKLHSDHDGMIFNLALSDDNVHPWIVVLDNNNTSYITHNGDLVAYYEGSVLNKSRISWVWFRFHHGQMDCGLGTIIGQNVIMSGTTQNALGGGYYRIGIGKTGNYGAFELLDVQPMELRWGRNRMNRNIYQ